MRVLVTGSSGLIGASIVDHFSGRGHDVVGVDNNMRQVFFGPAADTSWVGRLLAERHADRYRHVDLDVRDADGIATLVADTRPDLIVHAAAQPSHDLAATMPVVDFGVNALGTLHLLEASRHHAPMAPFVFLSTNKVYGDAPNEVATVELATRYEYAEPERYAGIDETMRIDASTHSLFGVSKAAADLLVQEYGRTFDLQTVCLRAGCLTGGFHAGVPLHGFLSYLVRCNVEELDYTVIGYGGKQVRDNLHGADVARFCEAFAASPSSGAVYNIGGGRANACSVLEAIAAVEAVTGTPMRTAYEPVARHGDHRCYITDASRLLAEHPDWSVTVSLETIIDELVATWRARRDG